MQYDPKVIGMVIKKLRKKRGWTQEVASGFAGVARSHYTQIECGRKRAEIDTLSKIAEAFDMRLSELFRLVEDEISKNETE
ncbi:MAG: helix-turn-helix transcriptional regulator [Clostridia bacterium]|nr:helix-turn-helix transcriptional regulator [Clostridia bacterium]